MKVRRKEAPRLETISARVPSVAALFGAVAAAALLVASGGGLEARSLPWTTPVDTGDSVPAVAPAKTVIPALAVASAVGRHAVDARAGRSQGMDLSLGSLSALSAQMPVPGAYRRVTMASPVIEVADCTADPPDGRGANGTGTHRRAASDIGYDHGSAVASASPVPVGGSVPGYIGYQGDWDFFTFGARQGLSYQIEVGQGTLSSSEVWLLDSGGRRLVHAYDSWGNRGSILTWRAEATDRLFAAVGGQGDGTGTYILSVSEFEDDHGNAVEAATPTAIGDSVSASIDYTNDVDAFAFNALAGEVYELELAPGTLSRSWLGLHDSSGELLAYEYNRADSPWRPIVWPVKEAGEFFATVNGDGEDGTYTLTVSVSEVDDDHGHLIASASPLAVGEAVPGSIDYPNDVDTFAFDAREGDKYEIDVALGTLYRADVSLYDSSGRLLDSGYVREDYRRLPTWRADDEGRVFVEVSVDRREGTYTLTVSQIGDDYGDTVETAALAAVGESVAGSIEHPEDEDLFAFDAVAGEIYEIDVALGTLPDSGLVLYDSGGRWLTAVGNRGDSPVSRIIWRSSRTGRLFAGVDGSVDGTGTYVLTVSASDIVDDHGGAVATASPVALGEPVSGSLEYRGDEDFFAFDVREGNFYQIDVVTGALRHPGLELSDAGGRSHGYVPLYGAPGTTRVAWRAEGTGRLFAAVYGEDTGTYTLTVSSSAVEDDHGDTIATASPVAVGGTVRGTVEREHDIDIFWFDMRAGGIYRDRRGPGHALRFPGPALRFRRPLAGQQVQVSWLPWSRP